MTGVQTCALPILVRYVWLGVFAAFKLFWLLPPLAVLVVRRSERLYCAFFFFLAFMAGAGQLPVSNDTSRHLGHAFPAILLALELLGASAAAKQSQATFSRCLTWLVLFNLFVPQYYIGQASAWPFWPLPCSLLMMMFGIDPWNDPNMPWT